MVNILFGAVCVAIIAAAVWTVFKKQGPTQKSQVGGFGGGGSTGDSSETSNAE